MLDIKFIRENLELVKQAAKKKINVDLDRLVTVDDARKSVMTELETKKAEQNRVSADVATATPRLERNSSNRCKHLRHLSRLMKKN